MLRHTTYTIRPMWAGMGTWTYIGDCQTEYDGHNKKMWHYLIAPDNTRISIDNYLSCTLMGRVRKFDDGTSKS